MAKYIKQEISDLNGKGTTQAYYRIEIKHNVGFEEFVEHCTRHGGLQRGTIVGTLAHVCHEMALLMASGCSVTIDGLGTFKPRLGVCSDKEQDAFEQDEPQRNANSLEVSGISYRADKGLISEVNKHCTLERGKAHRLRTSKHTLDERIGLARQYLTDHHFMRTADYAALTGLSRVSATRELRQLAADPASGITSRGNRSTKIYMLIQ